VIPVTNSPNQPAPLLVVKHGGVRKRGEVFANHFGVAIVVLELDPLCFGRQGNKRIQAALQREIRNGYSLIFHDLLIQLSFSREA
jgi:hypothetical protein